MSCAGYKDFAPTALRLVCLRILFRVFAQSHRRMEFHLRHLTGHGVIHRVRAKINAAGPFHTAEVGIDGDGVEGICLQQFQEHAAASLRFDRINPFEPIVEPDFQTMAGERLRCFNPNHVFIQFSQRVCVEL